MCVVFFEFRFHAQHTLQILPNTFSSNLMQFICAELYLVEKKCVHITSIMCPEDSKNRSDLYV
jgi:hypothetical protein